MRITQLERVVPAGQELTIHVDNAALPSALFLSNLGNADSDLVITYSADDTSYNADTTVNVVARGMKVDNLPTSGPYFRFKAVTSDILVVAVGPHVFEFVSISLTP